MSLNVAFAGRIARQEVSKRLATMPGITFTAVGDLTELVPLVSTTDVLVVSDPRGTEGGILAAALRTPESKVRWIQCVSAGVDGLIGPGVPESIVITNQGGAVAPTVAEHAMALLLGMSRQIGPIYERSKQGIWDREFTPPLLALEGLTLAIIGYGNVGREIARRAKAFEMRIHGLARSLKADPLADAMSPLEDLHAVLAQADVSVMCLALNPTTRHLMNAAAFAACKRGALFINVSRGETVDPVALRAALESGALGGAAVDVTEVEPLPPGDTLWGAPNLIISPHVAGGGGTFTGRRIAATVATNVERFLQNEPLRHVVARV